MDPAEYYDSYFVGDQIAYSEPGHRWREALRCMWEIYNTP